MLLSTHRLEFSRSHDNRMGSNKHQVAATEDEHKILNVPLVLLSAAHATKRLPEIIVRAQEEDADHGGLNNEEPGQQTPHERNSHLLAVRIDFTHQPIPGKG